VQGLEHLDRSTALRSLAALARNGTIGHSILLEGLEGSGKEAVAIAIARLLLEGDHSEDGGRTARLVHPDLLYVFPAEANLKLEDYREILQEKARDPLGRIRQPSSAIIAIGENENPGPCTVRHARRFAAAAPFEAPRRVIILADAHRMNRAAANALLKTLEEPPETVVLLLCTHQPHLLPATVRSRCARVLVPRLSEEEVAEHLRRNYQMDPEAALRVAAVSGGNARRALDLIDPDSEKVASWAMTLRDWLLQGERSQLLMGAERVAKAQDPRGGRKGTRLQDASLSASRDVAVRTLDFLVADLMALSRVLAGARGNQAQSERFAQWTRRATAIDPQRAAQVLLNARGDLLRNANVGLVLSHAFLQALGSSRGGKTPGLMVGDGSSWPR